MDLYRRSACDRCRRQKLRCVRSLNHGQYTHPTHTEPLEPCERCLRAGADCTSTLPPPRKLSRAERLSAIHSNAPADKAQLQPLFPKRTTLEVPGPVESSLPTTRHEGRASEAGTTRGPFPMALDDHILRASMHRHSGERPAKKRSREIENPTTESPSPENPDTPVFSTTKTPKRIHHSSLTANHHLDFGVQIHPDRNPLSCNDRLVTDEFFAPGQGNAAAPESYRLPAEDTQAFFANMESQPVDPTRECLQRLSELSSRLFHDFDKATSVMLSELLSFSSCRNTNNNDPGARIPQNIIGRALESSQTFLDILQGLKPRLSPTSSADSECSYSDYWDDAEFVAIAEEPTYNPTPMILNPEELTEVEKATSSRPPANPSAPLSTTIDMPTTLTILTCYTWLLQAYDTIFTQIYSALSIRAGITSPSSIPSVLPGLQFGGFDLDEHRGLQIEMLIQLSSRMLDRIEQKLGIAEICYSDALDNDRNASSNCGILDAATASALLDILFKQNHPEYRMKQGRNGRATWVRRKMEDIRALLTDYY
ncbi:hypothetical protein CNMCM5623_002476 [Aspergillus felis]|uniref:Zn(2)-C6 fungal-type domain-containing protein n=1 Tax=Aspergillus felis TaxID=1287682 RepID=A0A8H6V0X2_9EURO|nr:hypothetical protein CNMCM5623_002476 [Aspergillus felis]